MIVSPRQYTIIAGSIGTGKTTTAKYLAGLIPDCTIFTETRDIYLEKFYSSPKHYAFHNQLAYSLQYLEHAVSIAKCNNFVIQDRSIYDTHYVFSEMHYKNGLISDDDFSLLERIMRASNEIVKPNLMVLLDSSVDISYNRMMERGIKEEMNVTKEYLHDLRQVYLEWFTMYELSPKLLLSTNDVDTASLARVILDKMINTCAMGPPVSE